MRKRSVGGSLILQQALFLALFLILSAVSIKAAAQARDAAVALTGFDAAASAAGAATLVIACQRVLAILSVGAALGCILALGVFAPLIRRTVSRPLSRLAAQIRDLADGQLDAPIESIERRGEIGEIARALGSLRDSLGAMRERVGQSEAADKRDAPLARDGDPRARVGEKLAEGTERLNGMTRRMREASEAIIGASRRANGQSLLARKSSDSAAGDVCSVALVSERLLDSLHQINAQVTQSSHVVKTVVEEARASSEGIDRMSQAARRIGDVVSLISGIAAQTNLLALNATIEAARAGDLGRGFAIVAQEVKALAMQTGKATQDIAAQISQMQIATEGSVSAIESVRSKITEVERISAIVACAVDEQGDSTREIAAAVQSAAASAAGAATHVSHLETAIQQTGGAAETLQRLAHDLDDMANDMRAEVRDFAGALKAA